ncbi:DNA methylase [bacterium]|nr:DNA methylase [bacterium]
MATSYAHKFGQIVGDSLEMVVESFLYDFSKENGLYLDKKGYRKIRDGVKLSLCDINGNMHDLDFVIERDGSDEKRGTPVAFIECAWRRYTKHSRNKAQEIQGAIMPLLKKYKKDSPFIGVVLAGQFTKNSLDQLRSLGFHILYIPYDKICSAFKIIDIDASFDERTSEECFKNKINQWDKLTNADKKKLYDAIYKENCSEINNFLKELRNNIVRHISLVKIWSIYGKEYTFNNVRDAQCFLVKAENRSGEVRFLRFESKIIYSNGDSIEVSFQNHKELLAFLYKIGIDAESSQN